LSRVNSSDVRSKAQPLEHRKIILKLFLGSFRRSEFCPAHERGSACLFSRPRLARTASSFASESSEHHRRSAFFVCGHPSTHPQPLAEVKLKRQPRLTGRSPARSVSAP
jgi:hypothetical protein